MLDQLERYAAQLPTYTELRLQGNHTSGVTMVGGTVMSNRSSSIRGVSSRCYKDGAFGFASLPSTSDDDIPRVVQLAQQNAELLQRHSSRTAGELPEAGAGTGVYDHRSDRPGLTSQEQVDWVRAIDAHLRSTYPELANIDVGLSYLGMEKALVTSAGAATYSYVPRCTVMVRLSFADGTDATEGFGGFGQVQDHLRDPSELFPQLAELYEHGRAKCDGIYALAGEHEVVLAPDVAGILAHEAIGHTCEADLVLSGSVAGGMVGQQVASELVSLVDSGGRGPDGNGGIAIDVDDEGTPCTDVTLIRDGVLQGFLHNKVTAREFGVEPTGNARAYAFSDEPLVRMRNTTIAPGDSKLADMIAGVERGYYLLRSSNGQADTTSEFMFGITRGYEIVGGQLGRAIKDTTIAGVAFDMLKTVTAVSDDMTWSPGGMCGKKQLIPVGMGGPAIRCRISIGGR